MKNFERNNKVLKWRNLTYGVIYVAYYVGVIHITYIVIKKSMILPPPLPVNIP